MMTNLGSFRGVVKDQKSKLMPGPLSASRHIIPLINEFMPSQDAIIPDPADHIILTDLMQPDVIW